MVSFAKDYVKADSRNLPQVDVLMVTRFFLQDDRFNVPETRSAKAFRAGREEYGDSAIGYVSLLREGNFCNVRSVVCPEHKVNNKYYNVLIKINEESNDVVDSQCFGCVASEGGCKHAIALLMWLHRRSAEPSSTEIKCYWKKPKLKSVTTTRKGSRIKDLITDKKVISNESVLDTKNFYDTVVKIATEKQAESQLSRHIFDFHNRKVYKLSLHQLLVDFCKTGKNKAEEFIDFGKKYVMNDLCKQAEEFTRNQSDDVLWFELRYGRITASKLYETAHCHTTDGSLINRIIGAAKVFQTKEMERGTLLEKQVIQNVANRLKFKYRDSGLFIT